ncbi:MAG: hypothetical protein IMZ53_16120, partial [Thermoplasmata archaeon]|nr:hypothetical protein [Thermoplasmata archaeon]
MIWDKGNSQYRVDAITKFGDNTTATYFRSIKESVFINGAANRIDVRPNATLELGQLVNGYPANGSFWTFNGYVQLGTTGTINIYMSMLLYIGTDALFMSFGSPSATTLTMKKVMVASTLSTTYFDIKVATNVILEDVWFDYIRLLFRTQPTTPPTGIVITNGGAGSTGAIQCNANLTLIDVNIPNIITGPYIYMGASDVTCTLINPTLGADVVQNYFASNTVYKKFYCDINLCDKNGIAISGAVVDCIDQYAAAVWTAGTVTTDAS